MTDYKKLRKKRTDTDFSEHVLTVKEDKFTTIYQFKKPDSCLYAVNFINVGGKLLVTGDLGTWVFCREFTPNAKNYVSYSYWIEKLQMESDQVGTEWDFEETINSLKERILELEDHISDESNFYKYHCYLKECIEAAESENEGEYDEVANDYPSFLDCEDIIKETKIKVRLQIIFDAFNEICQRMEDGMK